MRVLFAGRDDALSTCALYQLFECGADVTIAHDGCTTVQKLHQTQNPFDLLVIDLLLPPTDGLEILKSLTALGKPLKKFALIERTAHRPCDHLEQLARQFGADATFRVCEIPTRFSNVLNSLSQAEKSSGQSEEVRSCPLGHMLTAQHGCRPVINSTWIRGCLRASA